MTEDELLFGLGEALTLGGWRWQHSRRSDRALVMGDPGLPDILAVHGSRSIGIAWELKSDRGQPTPDQAAWLGGIARAARWDARIVRPADYDAALDLILAPRGPDAAACLGMGCTDPVVARLDRYRGLCAAHLVLVGESA